MANYIVSYDLHNQRHYEPVWKQLEQLGGTRLLESLWVVSTSLNATQLKDVIRNAADNDDSVAVIQLLPGAYWACSRAKEPGVQWLRQNILA